MIIILGHQLWMYMKDKYSIKKTKDLVGSQIQKYKTILSDIQEKEKEKEKEKDESYQIVEYHSDYMDVKKDLEDFLRELQ
jgi:hypothetical protein